MVKRNKDIRRGEVVLGCRAEEVGVGGRVQGSFFSGARRDRATGHPHPPPPPRNNRGEKKGHRGGFCPAVKFPAR